VVVGLAPHFDSRVSRGSLLVATYDLSLLGGVKGKKKRKEAQEGLQRIGSSREGSERQVQQDSPKYDDTEKPKLY
jgi:hypothetical protein